MHRCFEVWCVIYACACLMYGSFGGLAAHSFLLGCECSIEAKERSLRFRDGCEGLLVPTQPDEPVVGLEDVLLGRVGVYTSVWAVVT